MIGLPIELYPTFPTNANLILLTRAAKFDPELIVKIKGQLKAGKNVVITSGLLKALQGKVKASKILSSLLVTGRTVAVR